MSTAKLEPSFWDAFKDPRFLITLIAIVATAGVAYYRLGEVEENQDAAQVELKDFQNKLAIETKERKTATESRLTFLENELRRPRYTLEDDEKRMADHMRVQQRELDRRQKWMDDQNAFRLQMVEFTTESRVAIREMRGLIEELKTRDNGN